MAAPAGAGAAAAAAAAPFLFPAGAPPIQSAHQVTIHCILDFLTARECLQLAGTCRRLRVDVAANGLTNGGLWRRGLVSLDSNGARAIGVIDGRPSQHPLPFGPITHAASLLDHVQIRLALRRRAGRNPPSASSLRLQQSHVGVTTRDILRMPTLRGLDLRDVAHMSSTRDVLERLRDRPLAGQSGPRLEQLLLPCINREHGHYAWENECHIFTAVLSLPHLRSLTCTKPRFLLPVNGTAVIRPSPITHLHAINADGQVLYEMYAVDLISLRLEEPHRLPRLFGIGRNGHFFPVQSILQQLTELELTDLDANALFPEDEYGGIPMRPAAQYWTLIWSSLPHLAELSLARVRHIDTLLGSLLPMDGPAPVPCPDLREILIDDDGRGSYSPSPAMTNSMPARLSHAARPQHVRIVHKID